eukprot:TRINITY_DN22885_c0_g1_i1.p1 TRINITY_DN22885_c0_g1~~TRINITY_DN22885_c0_g1_i1.p1  ORF type:complete len:118 (+),score=20.30 TRINITY_DN22885_c0_g1_i1:30-383(+)
MLRNLKNPTPNFLAGRRSRILLRRSIHVSFREEFFCPLPPGHSFPMEKYPILFQILKEEKKIVREDEVLFPEEISFKDLALVHTAEYLKKFQIPFTLTESDVRKIGIPVQVAAPFVA